MGTPPDRHDLMIRLYPPAGGSVTDATPAGYPIIGQRLDQIDTPALLLDLDRFERNARRILDHLAAHGVSWRPHSKAHKSPVIALYQVSIGAIGVTCAKVGEAEVMVDGGVRSILIANEQPTRAKLDRVARLQERAEVIVCADAPIHVETAAAAARSGGTEIPMLVEIDVGMARAGTRPGEPARELAHLIDRTPGVRFAGAMAYEGHVLTYWPIEVKEAAAHEAIGKLVDTVRLIERDGLDVGIVSCGGSGSYAASASVAGITEIQAGGACLMDLFYADECHLLELGYEFALTVATTVTSRPTPDRAIVDAGFKTLSCRVDVPPRVLDRPGLTVRQLDAEHGIVDVGAEAADLAVGDRLTLIPDYSDSTTFLHDAFLGIRDGHVESVIPLAARGRLT